MKTFSAPVLAQIGATQTALTVLFDFYLKSAIVTPYGTTDRLRLTKYPGGLQFFNPQFSPEPLGTQGDQATYNEWPVDRGEAGVSIAHLDDAIQIRASNVSTEFAGMLNHEEWRDIPVVIRVVSPSIAFPTADDCAVIFSGSIDDATITRQLIEFTCSSDLGGFDLKVPRENMHRGCRFRFADEMCGAVPLDPANYQTGQAVDSASTTTQVNCSTLTQDGWARGASPAEKIAAATITASHDNANAGKVKTGTAGEWFPTFDANWADILEGYWTIKTAQVGLANVALQPYIQFDLPAAFPALKWWQITALSNVDREELPRLALVFSSPDTITWTFQRYFEYPATAGLFEFPIHGAPAARYWRICFRTRWSDNSQFGIRIATIAAYAVNKNYWANGYIEFLSSTTTVALRGIRRAVMGSWQGSLDVAPLPVAPAIGDTFKVRRGCPRTFNSCAERLNIGRFGGFDSLPWETIVK